MAVVVPSAANDRKEHNVLTHGLEIEYTGTAIVHTPRCIPFSPCDTLKQPVRLIVDKQ